MHNQVENDVLDYDMVGDMLDIQKGSFHLDPLILYNIRAAAGGAGSLAKRLTRRPGAGRQRG